MSWFEKLVLWKRSTSVQNTLHVTGNVNRLTSNSDKSKTFFYDHYLDLIFLRLKLNKEQNWISLSVQLSNSSRQIQTTMIYITIIYFYKLVMDHRGPRAARRRRTHRPSPFTVAIQQQPGAG